MQNPYRCEGFAGALTTLLYKTYIYIHIHTHRHTPFVVSVSEQVAAYLNLVSFDDSYGLLFRFREGFAGDSWRAYVGGLPRIGALVLKGCSEVELCVWGSLVASISIS